ncbi:hypothetical protein KHS38_10160 [Mucilaginibacter sp. Bleaf8]|uniref:hypothetical protein n=1 Tax=Mucilaginibacter sp. Bleaf8 TaxID=2834430 RepID=UPI001BCE834E|nr:hypothetical protein [Mucilaginibacter sp. Bleaf8]MBS7564768.1 hypothetical protein [Mucilaginibacter sp. Bleaf8]
MIYISGQQLNSVEALSARAQSVLSMISGGQKWLTWSMSNATGTAINTMNENELLQMIQQGLYADEYIRFNTFRASINKILSMPDNDIAQLAAIRLTNNDNENDLAPLLQRNSLLTYTDIMLADGLVKSLMTGRPDLFQALGFDEMLQLAAYVKDQQNADADLQSRSHSFAQEKAATISDFINLSLYYQYSQQNIVSSNLIEQTQNGEIALIYAQLEEVIEPYLFTPSLGVAASGNTLIQAVTTLANEPGFIGYITPTSAILNLTRNITVNGSAGADLAVSINNYLTTVKNQIRGAQTSTITLSQNGRILTLTFVSGQSQVVLGADQNGVIYLLPETKVYSN